MIADRGCGIADRAQKFAARRVRSTGPGLVPVSTRHTPDSAFTHQLRTCPPPHHKDTTVHTRGPSCPRPCPRHPHAHTPSESSARYHSQGRHGTHLTWSIRTAHTSHIVDSQTSSRCSIRQSAKQSSLGRLCQYTPRSTVRSEHEDT